MNSEKPVVDFFWNCLKPFKGWLIGLLIATVCLALNASLKPYALRELINFLASHPLQTDAMGLFGIAIFYIFASLFPVIIYRIHNYFSINFEPPLRYHVNNILMENILSHPYSFFQDHSSADIVNAVKEIVINIPKFIKTLFDGFVCGLLTLLIAACTVGSIHYKFALGLLLWALIYLIGSFAIMKRAKKIGQEGMKVRSKILAKMIEIIENIKCVRLLAKEDFEREKLNVILNQYLIVDQEKEKCTVKTFAFQGFSFFVFQAVCLGWLIEGLRGGTVQIGDFALILTINFSFVDYFRKISQHLMEFADLLGAVQQGIKLIIPPIKLEDSSFAREIVIKQGEIVFQNVHFNYPGFPLLFRNKSVHIRAGQTVGIVGPSGSGKTTFINLILRFYEVNGGTIHIDNHNIRHLTFNSLRQAFGVVSQTPSLFHGTLLDNIRYGKLEATDLEVMEAARKAEIHDFIADLPDGYQTNVDSLGFKLSAGQRQRIAIARIILKNAPILILDEAMSNLDAITEGRIQDSLSKLMKGKTTLLITHRPSSLLLGADVIFVFEKGRIVESGDHSELQCFGGRYKKLWDNIEKFVHA